MGEYKKYEFKNKKEFKDLKVISHHKPVLLGFINLKTGEYDADGKEVTKPVLSEKYCIDIYWNDSEDSSILDEYEVFPKNPKHKTL